jgi:hypothetical protein
MGLPEIRNKNVRTTMFQKLKKEKAKVIYDIK